uniref:CFEM domain-containing protein n=1 Tax=Ganoderma boninense TaxID=34458 RepID=A0A5K1K1Y9_9APHY|nr:CFEM domain-containing protein [Ganoderma boninense]
MQFSAFILAFGLVTSVLAADPLVINTLAELIQCESTVITWSGGTDWGTASSIKDNGNIIGDNDLCCTTVVFVVSDVSGDQASTAPIVVSNSLHEEAACKSPRALALRL